MQTSYFLRKYQQRTEKYGQEPTCRGRTITKTATCISYPIRFLILERVLLNFFLIWGIAGIKPSPILPKDLQGCLYESESNLPLLYMTERYRNEIGSRGL